MAVFKERLWYRATTEKLLAELARFDPAEILIPPSFQETPLYQDTLKEAYVCTVVKEEYFDLPNEDERPAPPHFHTAEQEEGILPSTEEDAKQRSYASYLPDLVLSDPQNLTSKAGMAILRYLVYTQFQIPKQVDKLERYDIGGQLQLNDTARRNLELFETVRERKQYGSLFCELTAWNCHGTRLLRR